MPILSQTISLPPKVQGKNLTADNIKSTFEDYKNRIELRVAELAKAQMREYAITAISVLYQAKSSGFTASKTNVSSSPRVKPPTREQTKIAKERLIKRYGKRGDSSAEVDKAIQRALKKIDRMKPSRIAWLINRDKPVMYVHFGSYYAAAIKLRHQGEKRFVTAVKEALQAKGLY